MRPSAVLDLMANLHRAELNPVEQARTCERALQLLGCSKAELGRRLGISREQVSNTIRLLQLPDEDQARLAAGELTAQVGRGLLAKNRPESSHVLDDVSTLSQSLLAAKVHVTRGAERSRIVIDVPEADLARVLKQLGARNAA